MALRPPSEAEGWQGERLVNSPPAFHCFGLVLGNLAFWTHGACVIYPRCVVCAPDHSPPLSSLTLLPPNPLPSETFSPTLSLRAVHLERATALHGVPTMFIAELAVLDRLERGERVDGLSDLVDEEGRLDFGSLR